MKNNNQFLPFLEKVVEKNNNKKELNDTPTIV